MTDSNAPSSRYAIYYAPPRSSGLWQLAQRWLGRDCETGETLEQPALAGWPAAEIAAATESPRHYGFHATLKAPFHLAPGVSLRQLRESLGGFAARQRPFPTPPLRVSAIGPFLALTLASAAPEMNALAAATVKELDPCRAPLDGKDLQRRLAGGLTPRQAALLRTWGYPYVLEEFRFHMTLTGPLADAAQRERLQAELAALFRPVLTEPVPVEEICLYSQDSAAAPFVLADRFRFVATPSHTGDEASGSGYAEGQPIS